MVVKRYPHSVHSRRRLTILPKLARRELIIPVFVLLAAQLGHCNFGLFYVVALRIYKQTVAFNYRQGIFCKDQSLFASLP